MLTIKYKNSRGELVLSGGGSEVFRVTAVEGLGVAEKECETVSYAGMDGVETVSESYPVRHITVSGDVMSENVAEKIRRGAEILCAAGYLYISDGDIRRRIFCNRTIFPDAGRIIRGRLASFAVQFVCDNPLFEDESDTVAAVYGRTRNISEIFTLPRVFGETITGAKVFVNSRCGAEPILRLYCAKTLGEAQNLTIANETAGCSLSFTHTPTAGETVTIDIRNRSAESSKAGNIIDSLTDDSFLSEFRLDYGYNLITANIGGVSLGLTVECVFNNVHEEAMIV